jgi:hypothetical protein
MFKKPAFFIAIVFAFSAAVFAQEELPKIAAYVTGEFPENEKNALASQKWPPVAAVYITGLNPMLGKALSGAVGSGLMKAKIYKSIERIDQHVSGAPTNNQIIEAGKKSGVDFVFVINVSGKVSVSILDVDLAEELANVSLDGKMNSPLDAGKMAASIINFILKDGPKPPAGYTPEPAQAAASAGRTSSAAAYGGGSEKAAHDSRRPRHSLGVSFGTGVVSEPHFRIGTSEHSSLYFGVGLWSGKAEDKNGVEFKGSETHINSFLEFRTNAGNSVGFNVYGGPGIMVGFYNYDYCSDGSGFLLGVQGGLELRLGWFLIGTEGRLMYYWRSFDNGGSATIGMRTGIAF